MGFDGESRRGPFGSGARSSPILGTLVFALLNLEVAAALAQQSIPVEASVLLSAGAPEQSFLLALSSMPTRPVLVVEATPPPTHPGMQLQIEATDWNTPIVSAQLCEPDIDQPIFSSSGPGPAALSLDLYRCGPFPAYWTGATVRVVVRALSFGFGGSPANVAVAIRAETRPATSTVSQQVDTSLAQREVLIPASRDTVIYADDLGASHGAGELLVAGELDVSLFARFPRRTLLAFDLDPAVPAPAFGTIQHAELRLDVTGVSGFGLLELHAVQLGTGEAWSEGDAIGSADGFFGESSALPAADWLYRTQPVEPWLAEGGDPLEPPIDSRLVSSNGILAIGPPGLQSSVYEMRASGRNDKDGLALTWSGFGTGGVQFASRENALGRQPPTLQVLYTPFHPTESGSIPLNVVSFIDEGQNFRWIYDLDRDGIYRTDRNGVCEALDRPSSQSANLPYSYRYEGAPFTGVECCTWRIDSQTGVVGTGQALFFHGLDASNPANIPPDTDQDGIRDICDNCPNNPNGPLLGSCRSGSQIGKLCRSSQECPTGGICDLSQADPDGDTAGTACPEPGLGVALMAGLGLAAVLGRRRASVDPPARRSAP